MKIDPSFCTHTNLKKTVKAETFNVPELGVEQLCLRIRVYCGDCKSSFVFRTVNEGFSTHEIGVVGDELIVPLDYPHLDEMGESEGDLGPSEMVQEGLSIRTREDLH